ncbi:MAG TPA: histone deacetylase [Sphingobacteriaceae bacterium]
MLRIAYHPVYCHPLPEGHRFPMIKYELIPAQLLHEGLITAANLFEPAIVDEAVIIKTHQQGYWERLRDLRLEPAEIRRIGFPLTEKLVEREQRILQGTIDGCHFAMEHGIAFNVAGGTHHAGSNWGEGFCLLNDQATAANYLLDNGLASDILMIDVDVHQGNGTAEIFRNEPRVFTFSIHGERNFPFRKELSDLDVPLPDGLGDQEYLSLLKAALDRIFRERNPDFIFYLSGVDVLATDKLGKLALSREGCRERDRLVLQYAAERRIPVQVSMGGGYSARVADIVEAHCNTFRLAMHLHF